MQLYPTGIGSRSDIGVTVWDEFAFGEGHENRVWEFEVDNNGNKKSNEPIPTWLHSEKAFQEFQIELRKKIRELSNSYVDQVEQYRYE